MHFMLWVSLSLVIILICHIVLKIVLHLVSHVWFSFNISHITINYSSIKKNQDDFGTPSDLLYFFLYCWGTLLSAIHETREAFLPTKWVKTQEARTNPQPIDDTLQVLKQVWFPGSHSDVGGGNGDLDLSDVSLVWMAVWNFLHLFFHS